MKKKNNDPIKTILIISVGFTVIYLITRFDWTIYISLVIGLIGIFSDYFRKKIHFIWMKLAWILSLIIPNILLSIIYYLFLFPISILSGLFRKEDLLMLKNNTMSMFKKTNKSFDKNSFEKPW